MCINSEQCVWALNDHHIRMVIALRHRTFGIGHGSVFNSKHLTVVVISGRNVPCCMFLAELGGDPSTFSKRCVPVSMHFRPPSRWFESSRAYQSFQNQIWHWPNSRLAR